MTRKAGETKTGAKLGLDHVQYGERSLLWQPHIACGGIARSCPLTLLSLVALALKSIDYETIPTNLIKDGGQQVRRPPPGHDVGGGVLERDPAEGRDLCPPGGEPVGSPWWEGVAGCVARGAMGRAQVPSPVSQPGHSMPREWAAVSGFLRRTCLVATV